MFRFPSLKPEVLALVAILEIREEVQIGVRCTLDLMFAAALRTLSISRQFAAFIVFSYLSERQTRKRSC